jgi:diguanylate cyclase (GGDEF)-like protein
MTFYIHPPTFVLGLGVFCLLAASVSFSVSKAFDGRAEGMREWTLGMASVSLCMFALFHAIVTKSQISLFMSNLFLCTTAAASFVSIRKLAEKSWSRNWVIWSTASVIVTAAISIFLFNSQVMRIASTTVFAGVLFIAACVDILGQKPWRKLAGGLMCSIGLGAIGAACVARGVMAMLQSSDSSGVVVSNTATSPVFLSIGALAAASSTLGFILLVNERIRIAMSELAIRDELTGLLTRRAFFSHAETDVSAAAKGKKSIAVLMIDIDHFKKINDTYGHAAGDAVIAQCARMIQNTVRQTDPVGRYGGEEFCALLIDTEREGVKIVAERLLVGARQRVVRHGSTEVRFTLSIGAYVCQADGKQSVEKMLDIADAALYQAKRSGRDRVVFHSDLPAAGEKAADAAPASGAPSGTR